MTMLGLFVFVFVPGFDVVCVLERGERERLRWVVAAVFVFFLFLSFCICLCLLRKRKREGAYLIFVIFFTLADFKA